MSFRIVVANPSASLDDYAFHDTMSDHSLEILDESIDQNSKRFEVSLTVFARDEFESLSEVFESEKYGIGARYEDDRHTSSITEVEFDLLTESILSVIANVEFNENSEVVSFEIDQTSLVLEDVEASVDLIGDVEIESSYLLERLDLQSLVLNDDTFRKIVALKNILQLTLLEDV